MWLFEEIPTAHSWAKGFLLTLPLQHFKWQPSHNIPWKWPQYKIWCYFSLSLKTAVNGIVYNLESLGSGVQCITLLADGDGLYKMSRLYVTPDAAFFRVHILVVDTLNCSKPCPDLKLGKSFQLNPFCYSSACAAILVCPTLIGLALVVGRIWEKSIYSKLRPCFHPSFSKLSQENQLNGEVRYQHSPFLILSSSKMMANFQDS